jgi:signal transduction histidine kinase
VPTALVSFVDEDCQFFPAATGLAEPWATRRQTPLSMSFCQHVVTSDDDLVITDAANDARVQDNLAIDELGVRAYLGTPLRAPGGETLGSLCAIDDKPREWSARDIETLHDIAAAVASTVALRVSEHRRAAMAAEVSHELRTPLTRLRFELDDLAAHVGVDNALAQVQELTHAIEALTRGARHDRVRDMDVDLLALCRDVASQREGASAVQIEGAPTVVRSLKAILHHVVALLVGAFDDAPLTLVVGSDDATGRIQLRTDAPPADTTAITASRRLVHEQLAGRLLESPAPGVAFELVLPL